MAKQNNLDQVCRIGVSFDDARALRRISMTLRRWYEYECGIDKSGRTLTIERDENDRPFLRIMGPSKIGYVDLRFATPDRERSALKRLAKIMTRYPDLAPYVQTDPRGCSLYILRPADVPAGKDADAYYNRGIPVY